MCTYAYINRICRRLQIKQLILAIFESVACDMWAGAEISILFDLL